MDEKSEREFGNGSIVTPQRVSKLEVPDTRIVPFGLIDSGNYFRVSIAGFQPIHLHPQFDKDVVEIATVWMARNIYGFKQIESFF